MYVLDAGEILRNKEKKTRARARGGGKKGARIYIDAGTSVDVADYNAILRGDRGRLRFHRVNRAPPRAIIPHSARGIA